MYGKAISHMGKLSGGLEQGNFESMLEAACCRRQASDSGSDDENVELNGLCAIVVPVRGD